MAETDPVIIRIIANQKDLEKSLAASVRATERAAGRMDKVLSDVGKSTGKVIPFKGAEDSIKASTQAAQQLSFQLNDIGTSLAGGSSPFQVMMQQGSQVAQVMNGLRAQGVSMGGAIAGAFTSMLNPVSLLSFGLIALTGYAVQYFTATDEGSKDAEKAIKKQRDLIRDVAKEWGDALPALKAYNDELERQEGIQKQLAGLQAATAEITEDIRKLFEDIGMGRIEDAFTAFERFPKYADDIKDWRAEWENLQQALEEGTLTASQYEEFQQRTNRLLNDMPMSGLENLQKLWLKAQEAIQGNIDKIVEMEAAAKKLGDTVANAINQMVPLAGGVGGIGPPITSGAGVFNPSQTQLENAKKAREDAEKAAERAARELEQATERTRREAEKAAEKAAEDLNKAIANQTAVAVDAVTSMLGANEVANASQINSFLKRGGVDLDAATTAWCAAFVNSALAQVGIKGSGSQVATSFMGWGEKVDLSQVQRGDVLVQPRGRGAGETGGHVGFATGQIRALGDEIVQVEMISGNSANEVTQQWVDASTVIARRSTEAFQLSAESIKNLSEESKAASEAAKKAAEEQARAIQQIQQQYAGIATSAITGFIQDLRSGVDAGEAFKNMLDRVIDSLIQMAVQMAVAKAVGGMFGGAVGGGVGLFQAGGTVGASHHSDGRKFHPAMWAGAPKFAKGGVVGLRPGEVPIIAHRGEVIIPRTKVRSGSGGGGGTSTVVNNNGNVAIDMGSGNVSADNQKALKFGQSLQKMIQAEMVAQSRPGGILRGGR